MKILHLYNIQLCWFLTLYKVLYLITKLSSFPGMKAKLNIVTYMRDEKCAFNLLRAKFQQTCFPCEQRDSSKRAKDLMFSNFYMEKHTNTKANKTIILSKDHAQNVEKLYLFFFI